MPFGFDDPIRPLDQFQLTDFSTPLVSPATGLVPEGTVFQRPERVFGGKDLLDRSRGRRIDRTKGFGIDPQEVVLPDLGDRKETKFTKTTGRGGRDDMITNQATFDFSIKGAPLGGLGNGPQQLGQMLSGIMPQFQPRMQPLPGQSGLLNVLMLLQSLFGR